MKIENDLAILPSHDSLLTILLVSLLQCIKMDTLGTLCKEDLN